jgi:hypothetical protein
VKKIAPATMIGWSGFWNDETLGWRTSTFVASGPRALRRDSMDSEQRESPAGTKFIRCRITVTPIKDKRGRYIARYGKGTAE